MNGSENVDSKIVYAVTAAAGNSVSVKAEQDQVPLWSLRAVGVPDDGVAELGTAILKGAALLGLSKGRITIEHGRLTKKGIPALCCYPVTRGKSRPLPLIFFQHGFTGSKTGSVGRGMRLASEGFFVVMPDARNHGERRAKDFDKRFHDSRFTESFFSTVKGTSDDISALIRHFEEDPRVDGERIGVTGTSMGGFISFMCASREKRIKAAAPLIGSPDWEILFEDPELQTPDEKVRTKILKADPLKNISSFAGKALLVQNGVADKVVPIKGCDRFHKQAKTLYKDTPELYSYIRHKNVDHTVTDEMMDNVVEWFKQHLTFR